MSPSCLPHRTPSHPASTPSLTILGCHALPPGRVSCSDPTAGPGFQGSASLRPLLPAHPPGASRCPHSGQSAPRGPGCPRGLTWPLAKAFPPKSPLHVLRRALTRLSFVGRNLFPLPSCPSPLALTPLPVGRLGFRVPLLPRHTRGGREARVPGLSPSWVPTREPVRVSCSAEALGRSMDVVPARPQKPQKSVFP